MDHISLIWLVFLVCVGIYCIALLAGWFSGGQSTNVSQCTTQDELNLSVQTAQVIISPVSYRLKNTWVNT